MEQDDLDESNFSELMIQEHYDCGRFANLHCIEKHLARTNYSDIYKVRFISDRHVYTIKQIIYQDKDKFNYSLREVKLLLSLRSEYVARYICSWIECYEVMYIKLEYYPYTLSNILDMKNALFSRDSGDDLCSLDYYISCELFRQLLDGLNYLQQADIIHRNLKPEFILVSAVGKRQLLKISDLGLAVSQNSSEFVHNAPICKNIYTAPEIIKGKEFETKSDMYSLGVMAELDLFNIDLSVVGLIFANSNISHYKINHLFDTIGSMQTSPDWTFRPNAIDVIQCAHEFCLTKYELVHDQSFVTSINRVRNFEDSFIYDFVTYRISA